MQKTPVRSSRCHLRLEALEHRRVLDSTAVFNEIMYHSDGNDDQLEWIELYNQLSMNLDLTGWRIDGGVRYQFDTGTILSPHGFLLVAADPQHLENETGLSGTLGPFTGRLSNAGEELRLINNSGRVMNTVDYNDGGDWPVGPDGSGSTLAKRDEMLGSHVPENWTTSAQQGGTPGAVNFLPPTAQVREVLVDFGDSARVLVPPDDGLGLSWTQETFDDSGWTSGPTGVGYELGSESVVAYGNLPGAQGTSAFSFSYGHDFVANSTITVTQLGVFDNAADGLSRTLTAELWSRNGDRPARLAKLEFTSAQPGTLVESNRFKELVTPLVLSPGDYTIVAHGYGSGEPAGHEGFGGPGPEFKTLNDGQGAISFTDSRLGTSPGSFPTQVETGSANYYSAGTFEFNLGATGHEVITDIQSQLHLVNTTAYVRIPFNVADTSPIQAMTLEMQYNDGFVAYLNGQEVAHRHAPAARTWNAAALTSVGGISAEVMDLSAAIGALQAGTNLLAVHGLNATAEDDRFLVLPQLSVLVGSPPESELAINEMAAGTAGGFFLEIANDASTRRPVDGYVIATSSGAEYVLPGQTLAAGGFLSVTSAELGFTPEVGDNLFLFRPGRAQLVDARKIDGRLRGRSTDHDGRWLYPDVATPQAVNSFNFQDAVVINEIMYHPYGELSGGTNDIELSVLSATRNLIEPGDQASVFVPPDGALETGWTAPHFDDTSWVSGPTGIGYDAGGVSGVVAYGNLPGASGTSSFAFTYGHDFVANSSITVTHLGVFDSGADGLSRTLTAELWSRSENSGSRLAQLMFTPANPGTLVDSNRLKPLATPLLLDPGDYTLAAHGYGSGEAAGNEGFGGPASEFKTLDDGGGVISFVGSRMGTSPGSFPTIVEAGGVNYYSSGTFQFDTTSVVSPSIGTDLQSDMQGANSTVYVRVEFAATVPAADELAKLWLKMKYDDGFVAYLNGTEVIRRNAPPNPTWNSSATASTGGVPEFETIDLSAHVAQLVTGTNVLAIHGMNQGVSDDEFLLVPELQLITTERPGEDWLELYNRGAEQVDVSGWSLTGAIDYDFPAGTTLETGQYLVVAADAHLLAARYPSANVIGDFSRRLSNRHERIQLVDQNSNPADEVHYYDDKPWPAYADGGRSSLELRDPDADNSSAEAWAASDESEASSWNTYTYRGVAGPGDSDAVDYHELVFGMLDAGELLLDNISVVQDPDGNPRQLIQNGSFDSGDSKWRILGNHHGQVVADPKNPANQVLHLKANGVAQDWGNHVETTLKDGDSWVQVTAGREYEISFRARWLAGSNQLHTRLYYNEMPRTHLIEAPVHGGTPGSENSRWQGNIGPTYHELKHAPPVPDAGEEVTVSVVVEDPDSVDSVRLHWSVASGTWTNTTMTLGTGGRFTATVPGQSTGKRVHFYVEAEDARGATSTFPAAGRDARAMWVVEDGQARLASLNNLRIIMQPSDYSTLRSHTNLTSNDRLGATVIVNESEVFYDVGVRVAGVSRRNTEATTGFSVRFHADQLLHGVHDTVTVSRNDVNEEFVRQLLLHAGDIPAMYNDLIRFIGPTSATTGPAQLRMARFDDVYLNSQFANGSQGTLFEKELVYRPQLTGDVESLKTLSGYSGGAPELTPDIEDLGSDKETYRQWWRIKNNRQRDDYQRIVEMNQAFSLTGDALDAATREIIDVDLWMRTYAAMRLFGNPDFYGQLNGNYQEGNNHNYHVYVRPADRRVIMMPWDIDHNGPSPTNASLEGVSNLAKIIELPGNLRRMYGHVHDLIDHTYNPSIMTPLASHLNDLVPGLPASPLGFFGLRDYIVTRSNYILTNLLPDEVPFAITTNAGEDFTVDQPTVTLSGNAWYRIRDIFIAGRREPLEMTWRDADTWEVEIPLLSGANVLNFVGYDYRGQLTDSDTITVTSTTGTPAQQSLRIAELHYNPYDALPQLGEVNLDNDEFEFVELVNIGTGPLDLAGVKLWETDVLGDLQGINFEFSAQILAAGERIVVVKNTAAFQSRFGTGPRIAAGGDGTGLTHGEYGGKLSNQGERITLLDAIGAIIQQFDYDDRGDWPGRADGNGSSLEVIDLAGDYNNADNWRSSTDFGGSPAALGSLPVDGVLVNEVLANTDLPWKDSIELVNHSAAAVDISGWYLSDSSQNFFKFAIPAETWLSAGGYLIFDEDDFNPGGDKNSTDFSLSSFGDDVWLWSVDANGRPDKLSDHVEFSATLGDTSIGRLPDGNPDSDLVPLTATSLGSANSNHRPGELVLSEVHYNPSGIDTGLEFLEVFNASTSDVDLGQWRIDRAVDLTLPSLTLRPGQAVVLVDFDPVVDATQAVAFRAAYAIDSTVDLVGPWQVGDVLDDGGERINLELKNEVLEPGAGQFSYRLIDQVRYDDLAPWPTEADGSGLSLQRDTAAAYGNDSASWTAAPPSPGRLTGGSLAGDFNGDQIVDDADIDQLFTALQAGSGDLQFDVDGSGTVTSADITFLVESILGTSFGDVDLDGDVDTGDLTRAIINFTSAQGNGKTWSQGDTDGDGDIDTSDLTRSIIHFTGAQEAGVVRAANSLERPLGLALGKEPEVATEGSFLIAKTDALQDSAPREDQVAGMPSVPTPDAVGSLVDGSTSRSVSKRRPLDPLAEEAEGLGGG